MRWNQRLDLVEVVGRYPCVVFRGNQPYTARPMAGMQIPGFTADDICEVGEETVFTRGIKCDGSLPVGLAK